MHAYITHEITLYEIMISYPDFIYEITSWFQGIWNHIIEITCLGYDFTKPSHMISGYLWYHSFKYEIILVTHDIIVKPIIYACIYNTWNHTIWNHDIISIFHIWNHDWFHGIWNHIQISYAWDMISRNQNIWFQVTYDIIV